MIPVSPDFQAEGRHGLGAVFLPVTEMETGERFVGARQGGGVAQVIVGVGMRRHELVEEFLVNVGRALGLAGLGEMSPQARTTVSVSSSLSKKRGSGRVSNEVPGDESIPDLQVAANRGIEPVDVLELNRALDALAQEDEPLAQLIEMRYFGGMTAKELAEFLGRSVHTVRHDLRLAQAWLHRELSR